MAAPSPTVIVRRLSLLYTSALLAIAMVTPICGHGEYLTACCGLNLMDDSQQVVIDTGQVLTPGVYQAVTVRVCTTEQMLIQVWTQIDSQTFQLKWQTPFRPTAADTLRDYVTRPFDASSLLTITDNDRLGLYGNASLFGLRKLNVPYSVNDTSGSWSFRLSQERFNDSLDPFVVGQLQVTVQDQSWPRTFEPYLSFCTTADCSDVSINTTAVSTTRRPPADLPSCGCPSSCSPSVALGGMIKEQKEAIESMQEEVTRMREQVRSLVSATVQTGFCPDDFAPGLYGIGSCYVIYRRPLQLAEAAVRCSEDHGANLVAIESEIEQRFIYSIVTNNGSSATGRETFWTSGMYSVMTRQWMWYRQDWTPRSPIAGNTFRGWHNNAEPTPSSPLEACLVIDVDPAADDIYWRNDLCILPNFYICEIPKICY